MYEKHKVDALISAQSKQGDMFFLECTPYQMKRTPWYDKIDSSNVIQEKFWISVIWKSIFLSV